MKSILFLNALALTLFASTSASAQDRDTTKTKNLGNDDITVVKEYQPVLNDAFKLNITPEGDTSTVSPVKLVYKIDAKPMNPAYNASPIKPVRIKDDSIKKLYKGFVKAGYGLENMPLLDVYLNTLRSKNFDAGIQYHHLSNAGKINDWGYPGSSNNTLGVKGTRYFDKFSLNGKLGFDRKVVHYYGFQSPPDIYSKSETKHLINDFSGRIGMVSRLSGKEHWNYGGGIDFYATKNNFSSSENKFGLDFKVGKEVKDGSIEIDGDIKRMGLSVDSIEYNRSIVALRPRISIHRNLYTFSGGVNASLTGEDGITKAHLHPYLHADYQIVKDAFTVFGEVTGDIQEHSLRSGWNENPFLYGMTLPENSNQKIALLGGLRVKLDHDLSFQGSASFSRFTNYLYYVNVSDSLFPTTYAFGYDDLNLISVKAALEYNYNQKVNISFQAEFNQYKTDKLEKPLFSPTLRLSAGGSYTIAEKIYLKADLFYNGESYALDNSDSLSLGYTKVNSWIDANIGIDYRYSKVLSMFMSLNNLGFSRNYHWYNYPSYRFTGMIGATYSF